MDEHWKDGNLKTVTVSKVSRWLPYIHRKLLESEVWVGIVFSHKTLTSHVEAGEKLLLINNGKAKVWEWTDVFSKSH